MAPITLGRRGRLAVKIGGFALLALVTFVFALQLTFNYGRVKDKFLVEGLASTFEVTVGEVSRGIMPGKFTLERVTLRSRPTKADEVPSVMVFDKIEANVGVLALVGKVLSVEFEATIGGGTITGSVELPMTSTGTFKLSATGHGIKGDALPQLREKIGLPLIGKLDLSVSVNVASSDWRKATGHIALACPKGCTLGDGQTKFNPPVKNQKSAAMMGDGVEFGRVDIDKLDGRAELKDGKLEVTRWDFVSKDAELKVELGMKLAKKFKESDVTGCFRYRALPALSAREPRTATALQMIGGILGPDNLFHVKLECPGGGGAGGHCPYSQVKARGKVCGDGGDGGDMAGGSGKSGRPALSAPTTDPAKPATEPGADINPVPVFPDAAPAIDAAGSGSGAGSAGSGSAGSGSAAGLNGSGSGQPGAAPGSAVAPSADPGDPGTVIDPQSVPAPSPPEGEGVIEQPPPVAPRENE